MRPEIAVRLDAAGELGGDAYVVTGSKAGFVSNGGIANAFVVNVALAPELVMRGTGVSLVPGDLPGISRGKPLDKLVKGDPGLSSGARAPTVGDLAMTARSPEGARGAGAARGDKSSRRCLGVRPISPRLCACSSAGT